MPSLNVQNILSNEKEFTLCFNYFQVGQNWINVHFESLEASMTLAIEWWYCQRICDVWYTNNKYSKLLARISTNKWIYVCLALNLSLMTLDISIDQSVVLQNQGIEALDRLLKISFSWSSETGYIIPDKLTMINIHRGLNVNGDIECGKPGSLFKWDINAFWATFEESKSLELKEDICNGIIQLTLPTMMFEQSIQVCSMTLGEQIYAFDENFYERMELLNTTDPFVYVWLPFTDYEEDGVFRNVYTSEILNNSLFKPPQPNGGIDQNCLTFSEVYNKAFSDNDCTERRKSICQRQNGSKPVRLQGLCINTKIDEYFTPVMDNNLVAWLGNKGSVIQYRKKWILRNPDNNVRAETDASYSSLVLGTHSWHISEDDECYFAGKDLNLSLK